MKRLAYPQATRLLSLGALFYTMLVVEPLRAAFILDDFDDTAEVVSPEMEGVGVITKSVGDLDATRRLSIGGSQSDPIGSVSANVVEPSSLSLLTTTVIATFGFQRRRRFNCSCVADSMGPSTCEGPRIPMFCLSAANSMVAMATAAILCIATMEQSVLGQSERFRAIAVTGQPSPGTSGSFTGSLGGGAFEFNDLGHIAFTANFATADFPTEFMNGAWIDRGNGLQHIASSQHTLAGIGEFADWVSNVMINDLGDVAISLGNPDQSESLFSVEGDEFLFIAKTGQVAPGTSLEFASLNPLALTNSNSVLLGGYLANATNDSIAGSGIWISTEGILTPVAYSGYEFATGEVISSIDPYFAIAGNRVGDLAFRTTSTQPGRNEFVSSYWKYRDGQLSRIVQTGDIAPGTNLPMAGQVRSPKIDINRVGEIAFPLRISDRAKVSGIWKDTANGLVDVVLTNSFVSDSAATIAGVSRNTQINASGDVAFAGGLTSGSEPFDTEIATFIEMDGELRTIAREGQPIAGFDLVSRHTAFTNVQLNDQGMVAFSARIVGNTELGFGLSNSLWIDVNGNPRLVVAAGEEVAVGINDL